MQHHGGCTVPEHHGGCTVPEHHGGYTPPWYMLPGTMVGIHLPAVCPGTPPWVYPPPTTVAGVPSSARPAPRCVGDEALGSEEEVSPGWRAFLRLKVVNPVRVRGRSLRIVTPLLPEQRTQRSDRRRVTLPNSPMVRPVAQSGPPVVHPIVAGREVREEALHGAITGGLSRKWET